MTGAAWEALRFERLHRALSPLPSYRSVAPSNLVTDRSARRRRPPYLEKLSSWQGQRYVEHFGKAIRAEPVVRSTDCRISGRRLHA